MKDFLLKCCCLFIMRKADRTRFRLKHGLKKPPCDVHEQYRFLNNYIVHDEKDRSFLEIEGIFFHAPFCAGMGEVFGRRDYEFGGLQKVIFVDVGANIGDSALFAAKRSDVEMVYAFECFPSAYDVLARNVELNPGLKEKIILSKEGWSDKNESISAKEWTQITDSCLNSIEEDFSNRYPKAERQGVNIVLGRASDILSRICTLHPHNPIVLKMDIEGAEYRCLMDLDKNQLLKQVDIVLVEWHLRGYDSIVKILEKSQFVWFNEQFEKGIGLLRAYRRK